MRFNSISTSARNRIFSWRDGKNKCLLGKIFLGFDRFELFTQVVGEEKVGEEKDDGMSFWQKMTGSYISGK